MLSIRRLVEVSFCLAVLAASVPAGAQGVGRTWLSQRVGELKTEVDYGVTGSCNRDVKDQDAELALIRHSFHVFAPLWQNEREEVAARISVDAWDVDTEARLTRPNVELPEHLWDLQFGGMWRRKLDNGWIVGAGVEVGSPSDKPFDSCEETSVNAMGSLRMPAGERDAWLFFVQYSNNRSFLPHVPIPGVAYQWVPDPKRFRAVVGVPFSQLYAEPIDRLYVQLRYLLVRQVHAEIGYRVLDTLNIYAAFDWDNNRFFRAGRRENDDRIFYYEKRLTTGVRWEVCEGLTADIFGGYAFDRFFFEGEKYDDRDQSRIDVADGAFIGIKASYRF